MIARISSMSGHSADTTPISACQIELLGICRDRAPGGRPEDAQTDRSKSGCAHTPAGLPSRANIVFDIPEDRHEDVCASCPAEGEGHGWTSRENDIKAYTAITEFLVKHLC